jgi:hypothetical protein
LKNASRLIVEKRVLTQISASSDRFHDSYLPTMVDVILGQAMKQLVNLFRTKRRKSDSSRQLRTSARRRLQSESLEKRQLLAGDLLTAHNYAIAEDVNGDYKVSPLDALLVINHLSRNGGSQNLEGVERGSLDRFYDVSGDDKVTPLDALRVINRLSRGEAVGELIELRLNPRTAEDAAFTASQFDAATRTLTVGVNEVFNLELQYADLRNRFGGDFGAFGVYADIVTSNPNILEPVLTETQILAISGNLRTAESGDLLFALENAPNTRVTVDFGAFAGNPTASIANALGQLGFDADQISVIELPNAGGATDPLEYQIRFRDLSLAGQDIPNLIVTSNLVGAGGTPVVVTSTNEDISPRNADGTINQIAIAFNLDFRSRTFGSNLPFFGFGASGVGAFNPATGFVGVGATGPILLGGVPAGGQGALIEPFDVFSIPVRVTQAVSDFQVRLDPTGVEATLNLLYERDEPLPDDLVLINLTNSPTVATDGFGLINIRTATPTVTVAAAESVLNFTEDGAAQTLNLSTLTTVTGSTASPVFTITTQPARGTAVLQGSTVTFTPAANDFTPPSLSFVYTATVGSVSDTGTITVNITPQNDPPVFVADAPVSAVRGVAQTIVGSTLLANDRPGPANETGTVTIANVTAASAQGGTVTLSGQNIIYTSAANFTGADTISYTISDGSLTSNATLTVNVTAPTVVTVTANNSTLTFVEDGAAQTLDLSTLTTVTGSTTAPTFAITTQPARGTLTLTGSTARYTPAANDFTPPAISFVYTATVGSVSDTGTVTINITSVNDAPVFVADTAVAATTAVDRTIAVSTLLANDRPGPANETGTVTVSSVTSATAQGGTASLVGTNIVYRSRAGFTGTDTISYLISDGSATAPATLQVNVTAPTVVTVTAADFSRTTLEDTPTNINLVGLTTVTGSNVAPTITITTQPTLGTVSLAGGVATYTPAANSFTAAGAPITFVYTATVGSVSDTGTISVTITAVNDPPVFVTDPAASAVRGVPLTIVGSTLTANDRPGPSNETGTVTISAVTATSQRGGTVTRSGQNIIYTSAASFTGADTISYTITDGELTAPATLTVNVVAPGVVTVVTADSSLTFAEDSGAQTLNLSTLTTVSPAGSNATFSIVTQPARGTLALSGSTITYTPAANDFTTTPLTFVYRATVGTVSDTGTVSLNITPVNDPPVTVNDALFARPNVATTYAASLFTTNDRPGPANESNQTLTLTAVNTVAGTSPTRGTVSLATNGSVIYTPPAGFTGTDQFSYTVSDGSLTATGIAVINVADFVPSTISGKIFTDFLISLSNPIRNGVQDGNEPAMGGLPVRLTSPATSNLSGAAVNVTRLTDGDGNYSFTNVAPGTYTVTFDAPNTIIQGSRIPGSLPTTGLSATSFQIVISQPGGANATANNFTVLGTTGAAADTLDILVSQFNSRSSLSGTAFAALDPSGDQQFFQFGAGFEDVRFAEIALNARKDAALLTMLRDDGTVESALLTGNDFALSRNGQVIRLLGGADSFTPASADEALLEAEFGDYRDSVDAVMAGMM